VQARALLAAHLRAIGASNLVPLLGRDFDGSMTKACRASAEIIVTVRSRSWSW